MAKCITLFGLVCLVNLAYAAVIADENGNVSREARMIGQMPEIDDCKCGEGGEPVKIVGGEETDVNEFPFMVALCLSRKRCRKIDQICGGSLITDRHIITAAHCLEDTDPNSYVVGLGDHDLTTTSETTSVVREIKSLKLHRKFDDGDAFLFDIAILELKEPIIFTDNIKPICLPNKPKGYVPKSLIAIGFGDLMDGASDFPDTLQKVTVEGVGLQQCSAAYQAENILINSKHLCAAASGKGSCQGDSGGPLVNTRNNGKFELAGIVSFGIGCADPEFPGVYTNVSKFLKWIATKTRNGKYCRGSTPSL